MYQTTSPVLFIIYNRPDLVQLVFDEIKNAKPPRLYVAADGPSSKKQDDSKRCKDARDIIQQIDWPCEVKTLFREENAGCKIAVSAAITWFFEQEEMGIILEDDCLPDNSFFSFCDELLERYFSDTRIRMISGCNLQHGQRYANASYYFSNLTHVWGWASWRRVWNQYSSDISNYNINDIKYHLENIFEEKFVVEEWVKIFTALHNNQIDTWDYQFALINFLNNGLSIIPNINLIKNIGFRSDATHTNSAVNKNANLPTFPLQSIKHASFITPEKRADNYTLFADFDIANKKRKQASFLKKIKRATGLK